MKGRARWIILIMCLVQFVDVLGIALIIVALPSISSDLGMSSSTSSLIASIYPLLFGAFLIPAGRFADLIGHRKMVLAGLLLFGSGSLIGGTATIPDVVLASRALQGVAAATAIPAALALLTDAAPEGPARDRALGIWTAAAAAGGTSGWAIGGVLTDLLGWRSLFLLNLPIVGIAIVATLRIVPADSEPSKRGRSLDIASAALIPAGLILVTSGITGLQDLGNPVIVIAQIAPGLVLLIIAARRQRTASNPLLPATVRRNAELVAASAIAATITFVTSAVAVLLTFWLQDIRSLSASESGALMMTMTIGVVLGSQLGSRMLTCKEVRGVIALGLAALAASVIAQTGALAMDSLAGLVASLLLMGTGLGMTSVASTSLGLSTLAPDATGVGGGMLSAAAPLGTAIGIAALSAVATWGTSVSDDGTVGTQIGIIAALVPILIGAMVLSRARAREEIRSARLHRQSQPTTDR